MEFSNKFKSKWDNEVKKQAKICSKGYDLLCKLEYDNLSESEKVEISEEFNKLNVQDYNAVWYVGKLIWAVEHALADDRTDLNFINSTAQVNGCLNSESYWENVWKNDFSSEEASNLKLMGEMMKELMKLI